MADAVPVFALLPEQRLVSHDRPAGACRVAIRPRRDAAAEAQQTGRAPDTVWLATGGGHAALYHLPLPTVARRLYPSDLVSRPAETADHARSPGHVAAHRRPAASALYHGRPALERPL